MPKQIIGQTGKLKASMVEEYVRLHAHVWDEVLDMIEACNIRNYSIFLKGEYVFSYYEYVGEDYAADMRKMEEDPATQRWWEYTHPCFERYGADPGSEFCADMEQIFYFHPQHGADSSEKAKVESNEISK